MKKLNLLFIVSKTRIRKDGKVPLFCRLTYLDKRKQFAIGLFINPKNWNNSLQECELEKTVKLTTTFQSKLTIDFGAN